MFPIPSLFPPSTKPSPRTPTWPLLHSCLVSMGSECMHICALANLFQLPQPLLSEVCHSVPSIYASGSFMFVIYFVHCIPHMSEIIWYFSFSDWFISRDVIFPSSIHAFAKGNIFFFSWPRSIPLCKCTTPVLSMYLLVGTWAIFIPWILQITLL